MNNALRLSIKKRDWSDDNEMSTYDRLKTSLDEVLTDVSDKEGLSNDEYDQQMRKLKSSFTDQLPIELSKQMRYLYQRTFVDIEMSPQLLR